MGLESYRARLMQEMAQDLSDFPPPSDVRFGKIPGVPVGALFETRVLCSHAGVHTPTRAGISGSPKFGAFSIALSGAYTDNKDSGDHVIYTGTGGQADSFGGHHQQTEDQSFDHKDNMALKLSATTGKPVRVVRGSNPKSKYAPEKGFRYDGLYKVEKAYMDKGKDGYAVCRYELSRLPGQPPIPERPHCQSIC